jgi:hypothetical protein
VYDAWLSYLPRRLSAAGIEDYQRSPPCGKNACRHGLRPAEENQGHRVPGSPAISLASPIPGLILTLRHPCGFYSPFIRLYWLLCSRDRRPSEAWSSAASGAARTSLHQWKLCQRSRSLPGACCAESTGGTCPRRCSRAEYPTCFSKSRCARQTGV